MLEATWRAGRGRDAKLLVVDGTRLDRLRVAELSREVREGDLVVLNDAATLPALLRGTTARGEEVEARLAAHGPNGSFRAVLFGAGDSAQRTEERGPAPQVRPGDRLIFTGAAVSSLSSSAWSHPRTDLRVEVEIAEVDADQPRLVFLRFLSEPLEAIFAVGRPIQYAYVAQPLSLYHVTPAFAAEPWAFEPASAGLTLDFHVLTSLRAKGAEIAHVTHAAGLSSLGAPALDVRLPFAERSRVTAQTVAAVRRAKARGGRVFAIGTTVVRALESAGTGDAEILAPRMGLTTLLIGEDHPLNVVDAVLTGVHVPGESHHELLTAFQSREVLARALARAEEEGFHRHELGDAMLVYTAGA